jgi:hypothetical protein
MLEGLHLAYKLRYVSSDGRGKHLHGLDDSIGIDDETTPDVHPRLFIIDTVDFADESAPIG